MNKVQLVDKPRARVFWPGCIKILIQDDSLHMHHASGISVPKTAQLKYSLLLLLLCLEPDEVINPQDGDGGFCSKLQASIHT